MMKSKETLKKVFEFQKNKAKELKRPVTFSEAVALWFSSTLIEKTSKKKKEDKYKLEAMNY